MGSLKPIPISLADFWIRRPISILTEGIESYDWLLKLEARQGENVHICVPTEGRQNPAVNHYAWQQVDNHSNTTGTSPDLWLHAWLLLSGPLQETSGGLL